MHTYASIGPKGAITIVNVVISSMDRPLRRLLTKRPNSLVYHGVFLRRVRRMVDFQTVAEELVEDINSICILDCMMSVSCLCFIFLVIRSISTRVRL